MASCFGVSIDTLMGYSNEQSERRAALDEITRLIHAGELAAARQRGREAFALWPQDHALAMVLASALLSGSEAEQDECIALCRRILRDCTGVGDEAETLRLSAKSLLLQILPRRGRLDEAKQLALNLPSVVMAREIVLPRLLSGEARTTFLRENLPNLIPMITPGLRYTANGAPTYTADDYRYDIAVWDAVYAAILGEETPAGNWIYLSLYLRLAKQLADAGDADGAGEALAHLADCLTCRTQSGQSTRQYHLQRDGLPADDRATHADAVRAYLTRGDFAAVVGHPVCRAAIERIQTTL